MEPIRFYSTRGPYGFFSNFARYPVFVDKVRWPTSEHYYQAQKFSEDELYPGENITIREKIRGLKSPREAANMGRDTSLPMRSDWDEVKYGVMKYVVKLKFDQYNSFRDLLLSTTGEIIEDSPIDYIWGCGKDGTGKNWLGKILMEVREELKNV